MLLDSKNKFESRRFIPMTPGTTGTPLNISERGFQKWGNVNMYRTSYNDMSNRVSREKRKIPRELGGDACFTLIIMGC